MDMDTILRKRIAQMAKGLVYSATSRGGDTVADIADYVGLTRKSLDNRLQAKTSFTAEDVIHLTNLLESPVLIEFLCDRCGGYFTPNPHTQGETRPEASWQNAMELLSDAVRETGEGLSVSANVLRDRVATPEKKAKVEKEIQEAISAMSALLASIKSMAGTDHGRTVMLGGRYA